MFSVIHPNISFINDITIDANTITEPIFIDVSDVENDEIVLSINIGEDATFSIENNYLTIIQNEDYFGDIIITITATDSQGGQNNTTFTLTVNETFGCTNSSACNFDSDATTVSSSSSSTNSSK